jgi:SAM-dependent methyltransferase
VTAVPDGGVLPRERPAAPATLRPDQLYARLLATAVAHAAGGPPTPQVKLRSADGRIEPLHLERWLASTSPADDHVVGRAIAPVLDVGCGPGRLLEALEAAGKPALGVDLVPAAVGIARSRGGRVIEGSIFADVPGAGDWATALLLDGNIGIGGLPAALLERVAALLRPGGEAIVETDPPGAPTRTTQVRIESDSVVSEWFAWARVAADAMAPIAADAGLEAVETFEDEGRWFVRLVRA